MTPQERLKYQAVLRSEFPPLDQAVWAFLSWKFKGYGDNYDADLHDAPVIEEAARIFNLSQDEILGIWIKIDAAGVDIQAG